MATNPALTQQASRGRDDPVVTGLVTRAWNGERQAWEMSAPSDPGTVSATYQDRAGTRVCRTDH
jgi:hypothetical protein